MPETIRDEILRKIDWDEENLLYRLGSQIVSEGKGAFPFNRKQLIDAGRKWLLENRELLEKTICSNRNIQDYFLQDKIKKSRIELASVLADLLSGVCIGVSPVTVTLLVLKQGVKELCQDKENSK